MHNSLNFTIGVDSQDSFKPPGFPYSSSEERSLKIHKWLRASRKPKNPTRHHLPAGRGDQVRNCEFSSFNKTFPPMNSFGSRLSGFKIAQLISQLQSTFFFLIYALTRSWNALASSLFCCLCKSILPPRSSLSHISALPSLTSWPPGCKMPEAEIICWGQYPEGVKAVKELSLEEILSPKHQNHPHPTPSSSQLGLMLLQPKLFCIPRPQWTKGTRQAQGARDPSYLP